MSVFARRLSIEQLRHAGVAIDPANFVIARRPLVYGFQTLAVGTPVPDFMPRHKIVQFHRMRRLDVAPNVTAGQATAPRFQRNAGDTPELGLTAVATPVPVAAVATVTPVSADDASNDFDDDGGFQLPEIDIPVAEMDDDIDAVVTRPVSIPVPVPVVQREPSQSSNHKSKHNRNHNR